ARQGQQSAFTRLPVARRGIEQHQLQSVLAQQASHTVVVERVHEQDLYARKPRRGRRSETVIDVELRPEHRQIGGKLRHQCLPTLAPAGSSHSLTSAAMSSSPMPRARASSKRCSARAPSSSGTWAFLASSWIQPRSFRIKLTGVAGEKSRDMKSGRLRGIIVEPPNEGPIKSHPTCGAPPPRAPHTCTPATGPGGTPATSPLIDLTNS